MKNVFNKVSFYLVTRSYSMLGRALPAETVGKVIEYLKGTPEQFKAFLNDHPGATGWNFWAGHSLLMIAAMYHQPEHLKVLLDAGSKIDHRDTNQMTPLMWAADEPRVFYTGEEPPSEPTPQRLETIRILLERGANPTLKNDRNETAADLSRTKEIKDLLQAAEKSWNAKVSPAHPRPA